MNKTDRKCPVIIVPKRYVVIRPGDFPIFLAGPVLGGGNWQAALIKAFIGGQPGWTLSLHSWAMEHVKFIVPCRWGVHDELSPYFSTVYEAPHEDLVLESSQTTWEHYYLSAILANKGIIAFGLFLESKDEPRGDGQPYGRDTYGEVARWSTKAAVLGRSSQVIIGAHPDYPGIKVINKNLRLDGIPTSAVVYSPEGLAEKLRMMIENVRNPNPMR